MKTGKLKGMCDSCQEITNVHVLGDTYGEWVCEACDPPMELKIREDMKTGKTYLVGLDL